MSASRSPWLSIPVPRDGAHLRLVCFPHGGGGPQAYRDWAAILPDWIEVVAVQPPGRGRRWREAAVRDMTAMKSQVADAVEAGIEGPFAFFGHSVGALVAFEVAKELEWRSAAAPLRVILSAFCAPRKETEDRDERLHGLNDEDLLTYLAGLGHSAGDASADPDFQRLMLEAVRADFELAESCCIDWGQPLMTPITAIGGRDDAAVPRAGLLAWKDLAGTAFAEAQFPGGHFYTESARDELLSYISKMLRGDLDRLPKSLLFGPSDDYPRDACLHELFRLQAARTPDALALLDPVSRVRARMTFAELDRLSDRLAQRFIAQGCGPERAIAILMQPCADFVIAMLAALKAGGPYLPIPSATPDAGIAEILDTVQPAGVVIGDGQVCRLPARWRQAAVCTVLAKDWPDEFTDKTPAGRAYPIECTPRDPAYVVMTSGTTGKPKGIVGHHRGAVNSYSWRYRHLPYRSDEREACNVFFVWEVLRPLLQGSPAVIIPDDVIFDPRRLVDFLAEHQVTRVLFTPSLLDTLLSASPERLAESLPKLGTVVLNGEVVTAALAKRFATALPHATLVNDYSISECHDVATRPITNDEIAATHRRRYSPVGRPMSNVNLYVLDEAMQPVPFGVTGEIYVGGDSIGSGYLNAPARTAERFLTDPFAVHSPEGGDPPRMFRTGDIGRILPDGEVEILGRAHFMVKLRGYTVVPAAIEAEIRTFDQCEAAAVIAIDDPETGQPCALVAYVVGSEPAEPLDKAALRAHLKTRLPPYAIPRTFLELHRLPIDPATGKIDRRKLPDPESAEISSRAESPPVSDGGFATQLAKVWQGVLGITSIAPGDNFFDLGGHSLLAAEMTGAVADTLGIDADVIDVFDKPIFEDYANHLRAKKNVGQGAVTESPKPRARPRDSGDTAIAVIGMAGRFPGANSIDALWQRVCEGASSIRRFDDDELRRRGVPESLIGNPDYAKLGAIVDDADKFDPRFFGLSQAEATIMDPQQRVFLECCWHALEAAGHRPEDADGNIGVYAGCYLPSYLYHHLGVETHLDLANPAAFHLAEIGNDKDYLASRIAFLMNLSGPAISVQTSCSTGLIAIAQAASALRAGHCDMALAGASSMTFPQGGFVSADGHIATSTGACRAFDAAADGTILGDGVGVVVLRRLQDALADGDDVLAVIKGHAINNDGATKAGYSAPSSAGQAAVIRRALDDAEIPPQTVGYIEAHGTGTKLGDPIEVRGLADAYRIKSRKTAHCALGSIKPNIGHSNIASGVAGFIKAVLCVRHGLIPPLAGFQNANPELNLAETPFYIPTKTAVWPTSPTHPRRAGISSFGIGGTNCHVVIEQVPADKDRPPDTEAALPPAAVVLPVSAKSEEALVELTSRLASHIRARTDQPLHDIAATLQSGRTAFDHRIAVVAETHAEAAAALRQRASGKSCGTDRLGAHPSTSDGDLLDAVARRWEASATIDWTALRGARSFRRVALPGYPFARVRCWPQDDKALRRGDSDRTRDTREVRVPWKQMLYLPSWGRTPAPARGEQSWRGTCFLLSPDTGSSGDLAERLATAVSGPHVRVQRLIVSGKAAARERTLAELCRRVAQTDGAVRIVDLCALDANPEDAQQSAALTAELTIKLSALSNINANNIIGYWLLSDAILKVTDEVVRPLVAPLVGPLLAASQENPRLQARLIDIGDCAAAGLVDRLADEILAPQPRLEPLVALRGRHRWVERFEPLHVDDAMRQRGKMLIENPGGPHIITGGLGRIGMALAHRLVGAGCRVVLLSRRRIEDEAAWAASEFGNRAHLLSTMSCDVADMHCLRSALRDVAENAGGLGGIFHAAGLADLKYIKDTTTASIAAEFASKVSGTDNLRRALFERRANGAPLPDFVLASSSLASILGGLGMTGYAAANRYLDAAIAEAPEVCGKPWIGVNFDDWEFDYDKEQVGAFAHTRKGLAIPVPDGLAILETIIGAGVGERVVVSATPLDQRIAKWGRLPALATFDAQANEGSSRADQAGAKASKTQAGQGDVLAIVLMAYAKVIGSRDLAADSNFFELGGDSLLAAQMAMELRGALPAGEAGIGEIFDFPTPRLLAEHLERASAVASSDIDVASSGQHCITTA